MKKINSFSLVLITIIVMFLIITGYAGYSIYNKINKISEILNNSTVSAEINMPDGNKETKNVFLIAPIK